MKGQANRLEQEMKKWEAREQRFSKLFSPSILQSRAFKKEKVKHLRNLNRQFRWTSDPEERMTRRLLNQERRQLENELYPNRLKRNFFRFIGSVQRLTLAIVKPASGEPTIKKAVSDLKKAGFAEIAGQLDKQKRNAPDILSLSDKRKINEQEELQYRPLFNKQANGTIHYEGHAVTLISEGKTSSYKMDVNGVRLNEQQAYNLLSGRPVLVKGHWLSLDRNDKDAVGNMKIVKTPEKNGMDISAALSKLPLKENRFAVAKEELIRGLKNGDKVAVTIKVNGKENQFYITAGSRELNLLDKEGKSLSMKDLSGKNIIKGQKIPSQTNKSNKVQEAKTISVSKGMKPIR